MIRSAVTLSLVAASSRRAVCLLGDVEGSCAHSRQSRLDAVEIFAPSADFP